MASTNMPENAVVIDTQICIAYDTEINWYHANPILLKGQIACSSDYAIYKTGDGVTPWRNLPYNNAGSLVGAEVSVSEINQLSGITANVQEQINHNKLQISNIQPEFECTWFHIKE